MTGSQSPCPDHCSQTVRFVLEWLPGALGLAEVSSGLSVRASLITGPERDAAWSWPGVHSCKHFPDGAACRVCSAVSEAWESFGGTSVPFGAGAWPCEQQMPTMGLLKDPKTK